MRCGHLVGHEAVAPTGPAPVGGHFAALIDGADGLLRNRIAELRPKTARPDTEL